MADLKEAFALRYTAPKDVGNGRIKSLYVNLLSVILTVRNRFFTEKIIKMGHTFNLSPNRYSNCTVLLRIRTLNLWEYVRSRASLKTVTYVYWAWNNKLKNAVIYLIRQTSREKCKLFSWSVRDLIMMKVPATKTVKTFFYKKTSVYVKGGIGTKDFNNCNKCCIYWKQRTVFFFF